MKKAIDLLKKGEIVAYPTETFYGLGVDAFNESALLKLSLLKGRPQGAPFPLLTPSLDHLQEYVKEIPPLARGWMKKFWPGALTLILKAPRFPKLLQGENGGVGFRISSHPFALDLVNNFGQFITTTSANISNHPPAETAAQVLSYFKTVYVLDGGKTEGGKPSTVVDFTSGRSPLLIREGVISRKDLKL